MPIVRWLLRADNRADREGGHWPSAWRSDKSARTAKTQYGVQPSFGRRRLSRGRSLGRLYTSDSTNQLHLADVLQVRRLWWAYRSLLDRIVNDSAIPAGPIAPVLAPPGAVFLLGLSSRQPAGALVLQVPTKKIGAQGAVGCSRRVGSARQAYQRPGSGRHGERYRWELCASVSHGASMMSSAQTNSDGRISASPWSATVCHSQAARDHSLSVEENSSSTLLLCAY
jgi:hypothetical protein